MTEIVRQKTDYDIVSSAIPVPLDSPDFDVTDLILNPIVASDNEAAFVEFLAERGLQFEGWYHTGTPSSFDPEGRGRLPVVSFAYFKGGGEEASRRIMVVDGIGYGVFGDHAGQDEAYYLAGLQIGADAQDGNALSIAPVGRRNFSMDCIVGRDRGDNPVDAATGEPRYV